MPRTCSRRTRATAWTSAIACSAATSNACADLATWPHAQRTRTEPIYDDGGDRAEAKLDPRIGRLPAPSGPQGRPHLAVRCAHRPGLLRGGDRLVARSCAALPPHLF